MAQQHSSIEYRDMHFCYGQANSNADAYHRRIPHVQAFVNIHRRLGEQGSFKNVNFDRRRPKPRVLWRVK